MIKFYYNKYFKTFSSKIASLTEEEKEYINNIGVLKRNLC